MIILRRILYTLLLLSAVAAYGDGENLLLTWTDNSGNEDGFNIERSETDENGPFVQIDTAPKDATQYQDFTVVPGTQYWYRVNAFNSAGPSASYTNVASATAAIMPPNSPTGLGAEVPPPPVASINVDGTGSKNLRVIVNYSPAAPIEDEG